MSAFGVAMTTLFSDANLAEMALYMPMCGTTAKTVSIIRNEPTSFIDVRETFIATPTMTIDVMAEDCPELISGEKFLIRGKTYTVQGEPKLDSVHYTWRVDLVCD
jgi:hypothetical protein